MKIKFITTGGTIDKVYFDRNSAFEVGDPQIGEVLEQSSVTFDYEIETLFRKDSLDLTDEDRDRIYQTVRSSECRRVVVTHGTDTMVLTAKRLRNLGDKVVVLTGSLEPANFKSSNAIFNIGCAIGAVQVLAPGIYIAMNGRVFEADKVRKNRELRRFEPI